MPIIRILPSHRAVRGIYEYITRKDKTSSDYIFASGCSLDHPEEDFKDMADYFQKDKNERNRTYYHVIVSFNTKTREFHRKKCRKWLRSYVKNRNQQLSMVCRCALQRPAHSQSLSYYCE